MKRPRLALSLLLLAMAALVMFERFSPVRRGVAADLAASPRKPVLHGPDQSPEAPGGFAWFERNSVIACLTVPDEAEAVPCYDDCWGALAMLEDAYWMSGTWHLLLDHFSLGYTAVDDDHGLIPDFNYGSLAAESCAEPGLTRDQAFAAIFTLAHALFDWQSLPAFAWINDSDLRSAYWDRRTSPPSIAVESVSIAATENSSATEDAPIGNACLLIDDELASLSAEAPVGQLLSDQQIRDQVISDEEIAAIVAAEQLDPANQACQQAANEVADSIELDAAAMCGSDLASEWELGESDRAPQDGPESRFDIVTIGDLSDLIDGVHCGEIDIAAELNEPNQGLAPDDAATPQPAYEALASQSWPANGLADLSAELWLQQQAVRGSINLTPGGILETELCDRLAEGPTLSGCPFLTGESADGETPRVQAAESDSASPQAAWGGHIPRADRSDFGWYYKQREVDGDLSDHALQASRDDESDNPDDAQAAARLSITLADVLTRAARAMVAISSQLENVTQQAIRETARRQNQSARLPKAGPTSDVKTSEIIYVEI